MSTEEELSRYAGITQTRSLIMVHKNSVLRTESTEGLSVVHHESEDGVDIDIKVTKSLSEPVHICLGILDRRGSQRVRLRIEVKDGCSVNFLSHCVFPFGDGIEHKSRIDIRVGHGASVRYDENHVHPQDGVVTIDSKVKGKVGAKGRLVMSFTAKRGRAGRIISSTEVTLSMEAAATLIAKIMGMKDDFIDLKERILLSGCQARGNVKTRTFLRDRAFSRVTSEVVGEGTNSRGHIDCTEILMDEAQAEAYPFVYVRNPTAKLTHEAAIGRVDEKQMMTLMCRGLSEEEAVDFIVNGLLR